MAAVAAATLSKQQPTQSQPSIVVDSVQLKRLLTPMHVDNAHFRWHTATASKQQPPHWQPSIAVDLAHVSCVRKSLQTVAAPPGGPQGMEQTALSYADPGTQGKASCSKIPAIFCVDAVKK